MSGALYTSWKDCLGGSHIDEAVATYENGKIYVAADGFFGTTRNGTLIGEYENGKVYSIGTGAFNYGKRLNLVAIIEDGKIYSVQRSILGGVSKSLSVGECSCGKVYSHSHKLMEGSESFGLYNGDEEGAAASAAIALFKLKSDVSAYYDNKPAQDSSSSDDDLWEKYGLLMPIVVTYRIFKYMFVACKWLCKAVVWLISYITKVVQEQKDKKGPGESIAKDENVYNEVVIAQLTNCEVREDEAASEDIECIIHKNDTEKKSSGKSRIVKIFIVGLAICIATIGVFSISIKTNPLKNKLIKAQTTSSRYSYDYRLIYYDKQGKESKYEDYDSNNMLEWYMIFNYDDQGKLISSIEYDDENVVINRSEYIYDSNGNKVKQLYFDENGQLWINMKYFYDGDKVTEIWFDQDGEPIFDKYYVKYYNDDKKIREEIYKLSTDELMWYEITEYDKLGVQTTTTEYDETGKIIATTKYTVVE